MCLLGGAGPCKITHITFLKKNSAKSVFKKWPGNALNMAFWGSYSLSEKHQETFEVGPPLAFFLQGSIRTSILFTQMTISRLCGYEGAANT